MDLPRTATASPDARPGHRAAPPGRHRAAAVARAVRHAPADGLPALAPRRAAVAGVGLAAAAVGAGLALPLLTGPEAGPHDAAPAAAGSPPSTTAVPAVQLVAGSTLWPVPVDDLGAPAGRTQPAYVEGVRLRRAGTADAAPDRPERDETPAAPQPSRPGGSGASPAGGSAGQDGSGGDGRDATGDDGSGPGADSGDGSDSGGPTGSGPGLLDPVETAVAPVRDALPTPVGDLVDDGVALVEGTVAGPLGSILP